LAYHASGKIFLVLLGFLSEVNEVQRPVRKRLDSDDLESCHDSGLERSERRKICEPRSH
jgi:hypothetical protein